MELRINPVQINRVQINRSRPVDLTFFGESQVLCGKILTATQVCLKQDQESCKFYRKCFPHDVGEICN